MTTFKHVYLYKVENRLKEIIPNLCGLMFDAPEGETRKRREEEREDEKGRIRSRRRRRRHVE